MASSVTRLRLVETAEYPSTEIETPQVTLLGRPLLLPAPRGSRRSAVPGADSSRVAGSADSTPWRA